MGKKMYFVGEGAIPIKRGDTRFKGDPIDTDELDPKTVKRLVKKGWLVNSRPGMPESPSIAEYRTRLAKLRVENDNLKVACSNLEDSKKELQEANVALANANKELADTVKKSSDIGAGPKKGGKKK